MTIDVKYDDPRFCMLKHLVVILVAVSVLRALFICLATTDLFVDEIQYWWWSLEPAWGYYSKPPVIAWLIYLVTGMFGHSVFTIKLGAVLVYPLTCFTIYLLGQKLVSERTGFWAAVLFITMPGTALSSTIISTDVPLLFFWSTSMLFFIQSVETDKWADWIICGIMCGLGLMSKYNMAIFAISAVGYILFFGHRKQLINPRFWIMVVFALAILMPNIYWNYINDFPTFAHTAEYVDKKGLYPGRLIGFIFEQAGITGPVGFIVMWWWMIKGEKPKNTLLVFSLPMFIVICFVALQGKYNANWAAPMYIGIIIGIAHFLLKRKRWLYAMLIVNILLSSLVQITDPVIDAAGIELKEKYDPFKRVRGWKDFGRDLKFYTDQYPDTLVIVDGRTQICEAAFYTFGRPDKYLTAWHPAKKIGNHFQLTRPYTGNSGPALFLTGMQQDQVMAFFSKVDKIGTISRKECKDSKDDYYLYKVDGFSGYKK